MNASYNPLQDGKAHTIKKIFSRETSINIEILSTPSVIWELLTNASAYPRWNSTIVSIEGKIEKGEKIALKSILDPKRTFKLKIKEFLPENRIAWGDAMGTRLFTLHKDINGSTNFCMKEKIGGPLFPLFAKMIPPFDQSFEQFASDLKKEAEAISNSK